MRVETVYLSYLQYLSRSYPCICAESVLSKYWGPTFRPWKSRWFVFLQTWGPFSISMLPYVPFLLSWMLFLQLLPGKMASKPSANGQERRFSSKYSHKCGCVTKTDLLSGLCPFPPSRSWLPSELACSTAIRKVCLLLGVVAGFLTASSAKSHPP